MSERKLIAAWFLALLLAVAAGACVGVGIQKVINDHYYIRDLQRRVGELEVQVKK